VSANPQVLYRYIAQSHPRAVAASIAAGRPTSRKIVSDEAILSFARRHGPATIRDISQGLEMNHETATQRVRQLARQGHLGDAGERSVTAGGDRPYQVLAKLYRALALEQAEEAAWLAGESLESMGAASSERMIREEIAGALRLWARWAAAGRLRLNWRGDAHLALSIALDGQVARLEPHLRAAVEFTHGLRSKWGWLRHDAHESYDDALIELASIYRLPSVLMGGDLHL
jgi:hypothetical protein